MTHEPEVLSVNVSRFIRDMTAATEKYQRDMAFTAPELHAMRRDQFRQVLVDLLYQEDEEEEGEPRDPAAGDPVILRGRIKALDEGVALVEVYRSYPVGGTVAVQCGALELDESEHDGGVPESTGTWQKLEPVSLPEET